MEFLLSFRANSQTSDPETPVYFISTALCSPVTFLFFRIYLRAFPIASPCIRSLPRYIRPYSGSQHKLLELTLSLSTSVNFSATGNATPWISWNEKARVQRGLSSYFSTREGNTFQCIGLLSFASLHYENTCFHR